MPRSLAAFPSPVWTLVSLRSQAALGLGQPPEGSLLCLSLSRLIWELGIPATLPLRDCCENQAKGSAGSTVELGQAGQGEVWLPFQGWEVSWLLPGWADPQEDG